ncbi:hypothetical protein WICPIJ_009415 [Wickerhamomyces pijperi]|uniref:Uncharacterized protein n=1 Tax=Wickerhamomyces pijperi TaxID=599730 RepID=A0A9P8PNZ4_WICPI|nr:hypothetical protein WICPIJ_009415 [Wickerhamomyces pijperi]
MSLELGSDTSVNGVMTRVMWSWGNFIDQQFAIGQQEHLNTKDTTPWESLDSVLSQHLSLELDGVLDTSWGIDQMTDVVFMDGFDNRV